MDVYSILKGFFLQIILLTFLQDGTNFLCYSNLQIILIFNPTKMSNEHLVYSLKNAKFQTSHSKFLKHVFLIILISARVLQKLIHSLYKTQK